MILLAYAAGSFAGGLVASLIAGIQQPKAAVIVGSILLVAGIMNIVSIPGHPLWFIIVGCLLYIPFSYLGYLSVQKRLKASI
jgi:hypothetical protein